MKKRKLNKVSTGMRKGLSNKSTIAIFIILFAVVGVVLLLATRAASPVANIEPEKGTITSPATACTDAGASSGGCVQFKPAVAPPSGVAPIGPQAVDTSDIGATVTLNAGQSIASAISSAGAGSTIKLNAGNYTGFSTTKAAASEIKIFAAPGATVNITSSSSFSGGCKNLTFININWRGGVTLTSCDHIKFNGGTSSVGASTNSFEIKSGNTELTFQNLTIKDFNNSAAAGALSAFTIGSANNTTRANGIHILNNDIGRVYQDHVIINWGKNIDIRRNKIHDVIDTGEHSDGVQTVDVDGLWIERNMFYNQTADRDNFADRHDQGIMINEIPNSDPNIARLNTNVHIFNNVFYNSIGTALAIAGGRDIEIYNNTIFDCGKNGSGSCVILDADPVNTVQRVSIWNNILENFTNADATLSFNSNNTIGSFSGFVNPAIGDYHLKAGLAGLSSGTGIGGTLSAPTIDLDGNNRGNPPDRGAYEFN